MNTRVRYGVWFMLGTAVTSVINRLDHPECFEPWTIVFPASIFVINIATLVLLALAGRAEEQAALTDGG